jgi:pimeloyl-ACP methyl ester carboxylesterase
VIGWSWDLLTEPERAVLRRLALHADSCTLSAAEAICAGDGVAAADVPQSLARLVDRSLVVRNEAPTGVRYRLLESVGAYCVERLHASGEFEPVLQRHIAYYTGLSTQTEPSLYGHGPLFRYLSEVHQQPSSTPDTRPGRAGIQTVRSHDGTIIAYERSGAGAPVVLVGGALNDRSSFGPLVEWLAPRFAVITYDRRGRGASGDTPPYAVAREVEDLRALVGELAGPAYALGFSSGAVLAVEAALAGVGFAGLALIEPPFILDHARKPMPAEVIDQLDRLVAAGRRGDAVELFLTEAVEMPADVVAPMRSAPSWPALEALAHTIGYDIAVMDDFKVPARWASVAAPTLVVTGTESATWRQNAARAVAEILPHGRHLTLDGRSHEAPPEVIGPILTESFTPG